MYSRRECKKITQETCTKNLAGAYTSGALQVLKDFAERLPNAESRESRFRQQKSIKLLLAIHLERLATRTSPDWHAGRHVNIHRFTRRKLCEIIAAHIDDSLTCFNALPTDVWREDYVFEFVEDIV